MFYILGNSKYGSVRIEAMSVLHLLCQRLNGSIIRLYRVLVFTLFTNNLSGKMKV